MAFTYDPATDRGRLRLLLFDTDPASPIFEDADLDAFLALSISGTGRSAVFEAAILGCLAIASGRALGASTITINGLTMGRDQISARYREMAGAFRERLKEIETQEVDSDVKDYTDEDTRWAKTVIGATAEERETDRF